jgi:hypothetical protein
VWPRPLIASFAFATANRRSIVAADIAVSPGHEGAESGGLGRAGTFGLGDTDVGVVQQPVDGGGGQGLGHQFVEAGRGADSMTLLGTGFLSGVDEAVEPFGGVLADGQHADVVELCRHSWTYADPVTTPMPLFGAGGFASVGAAVECGALGSGRHIYRPSRNASIRSGGRYLPDCGDIGVSWASARSLMARSACR